MQVDRLREEPAAHIVHTDFDHLVGRRVLRNAHKRLRTPYLAHGYDAFPALLHRMTVMTATVMYRRAILLKLQSSGIARHAWPFGDYPKALFAAMHGPVLYLPISTAIYRKTKGSATNQGWRRSLEMQYAGLACREAFMDACEGLSDEVKNQVRIHTHRLLKRHAMLAGDKKQYMLERSWLAENSPAPASPFVEQTLASYTPLLRPYRLALNIKWKLGHLFRSERL
jgi:hypothetical protein